MHTKKIAKLFALIVILALVLCACGAKVDAHSATETAPAEIQAQLTGELGLAEWSFEASIWSSANGASVDLTAIPTAYTEGMTASFVVRLEGEDVVNNPCQWNGTAFTSYADLNAEDGYCYYVMLTDATHTVAVDVNTPTVTTNESLINLAASLESFCHVTVADADYSDGTLTIHEGSVDIQIPRISSDSNPLTCTSAELIMTLDDGALAKEALTLIPADSDVGSYSADLSGICFRVPEMKGDHQLSLTLAADLSDGSRLNDESNTTWFYSDGTVSLTVG